MSFSGVMEYMFNDPLNINTRELSILIWSIVILIFFLYFLKKYNIKLNLLSKFFRITLIHIKLKQYLIIVLIYIGLIFFVLYKYDYLQVNLIKDYLIWVFFGYIPLFIKIITREYRENKVGIFDLWKGIFKVSIIPLFIVNTYPFSFWIEFFITVPLATILTFILSLFESDKKYRVIYNFCLYLLAILGFMVLFFALINFLNNLDDIKELLFWKKFSLEIILIILHIPLLVLIRVLIFYHIIFVILRRKKEFKLDFKSSFLTGIYLFKLSLIYKESDSKIRRTLHSNKIQSPKELLILLEQEINY